jgi:membrane dipeptidase
MLAGGSDQPEQGLTELGRAAVRELNRLDMLVDVSHLSKPSVMETVEICQAPVMANHANALALTDNRRNKSDEELLAIAGTGGVVGVTLVRWMLDRNGDGRAGIDDFIAHVDYIVDLIGIDHVGFASDSYLNGWETSSRHYADEHLGAMDRWKRVVRKLVEIRGPEGERKYADEDLQKLLGLNFLRVYRQVLV